MRTCIVFACSGTAYASEALTAARRARRLMPGHPCVGFADPVGAAVFRDSGLFHEVHEIADPAYSFIDKTRIALPAHYDAALFLDTDTYMAAPVEDVFTLLDRFDLVVAHEPTRFSFDAAFQQLLDDGAPPAFPEFNTGVFGFRNVPAVQAFLAAWREDNAALRASGRPPAHDQPSFRTALWRSELRFYVLPPEYNFRFTMPSFIGGFGHVRILHGRGPTRARLARRLSRPATLPRAYRPWSWPFMAARRRLRLARRKLGLTRANLRRRTTRSAAGEG
jgi:hypothetical protein